MPFFWTRQLDSLSILHSYKLGSEGNFCLCFKDGRHKYNVSTVLHAVSFLRVFFCELCHAAVCSVSRRKVNVEDGG